MKAIQMATLVLIGVVSLSAHTQASVVRLTNQNNQMENESKKNKHLDN